MKKIDIDTLELFGGHITDNNNLVFEGELENSFNIIYESDYSEVRTSNYFKAVFPSSSSLIDKAYIFNNIKDALLFYLSRDDVSYYGSVFIIVDKNSKYSGTDYIKKHQIKNLVFYHRPNKEDLFYFYFDLIGDKVKYETKIVDADRCITLIHYQRHTLNLSISELPLAIDLIGKDERFYRIKNKYLTNHQIKPQLNW
ncbi:hypothetical protein [Sphingobacterium faecium]|uniref:hypothetical protein n=1 Tax=Sphingobacterium faecium TaxID=34087 RepID=UPI0024697691|nr:hypothetical protein [Sphingobacterium faecium]MDH5828863.1 hypothetical protein [Sphingobacterium faecium]WGQ17060.1 hypothetical protein QG727_22710 [Sphingobacterium faecium]